MTISNDVYKKPINYEPSSSEVIYLGMGCFWGAEKLFWNRNGIHVTAVGRTSNNILCNTQLLVLLASSGVTSLLSLRYQCLNESRPDALNHGGPSCG